ncbi:Helix-turn-helix domain-containing protein [Micromonospora haikouensis]|uniref:Helix-turn-helix domain-containing protein n=1 Tax=Micromonospora haikouensis TaxID=686309 RepID=A0A1C4VYB9_9ACTN|nr:helix-turn-helix domain-containing protein [Micromonospora haikouensis]SCE88845.1 Helix-turn-helix domain-containing protein [Micromonospora haikouensis]
MTSRRSSTDTLPIGRRVAYWRFRRRMSQQQFADTIGKSKSWVDKVERGVRALDKLSTLQDVADGLRVDVRLLLGRDGGERAQIGLLDEAGVDALRGALARWDATFLGPAQPAPALGDLRKAVNHSWLSFQHARYAELVRALPKLLLDAQQSRNSHPDVPESARHLAEAYQIVSAVMRKLGVDDLAWLAADRALVVGQAAGDRLLTGAAAVQLGYALLAQGQARHAMEISIAVAYQIAPPDPLASRADHLSVYGTLLVVAARGAATLGHVDSVDELLGQAGAAAEAVGDGQDHYRTSFGPMAVELARVAAMVDLGAGLVDSAAHWRLVAGTAFRRLPPERRAAHLLDAANGFLQVGDLTGAAEAVVSADRVATAEVRIRPVGHALVAAVLRRSPAASTDVLRLAEQMGVVV